MPSATTTQTQMVMGKRLEDHLRFAVAWWHSFAWPGGDPFGGQTFERPWFGDDMDAARAKADAAFDLFAILGQPFFCFHDYDIRPEGETFAESQARLDEIADYIGGKMEASGVEAALGHGQHVLVPPLDVGRGDQPRSRRLRLRRRHVKACMDVTHRLGGQNYVLWGGREGYETLLNTDLKAEADHAGAFLSEGRRLQAQDRLQGHDPDRAQAAGADQTPVRL